VKLAVSVAEQAALSFADLKLREKLRYQSIRDPLTGLFNRRYLDESLERELPRAIRKNRSLGIIMLDVDRFKKFNDMFGHDAGDTVLRELGDYLAKFTRREDLACRYRGEEFILILPESSPEDARRRLHLLVHKPVPESRMVRLIRARTLGPSFSLNAAARQSRWCQPL
jgi:diguanylate cyclase (GGDEF)-like protein